MKKILWFFVLQISILIYTFAGIAGKVASAEPGVSIKFILLYGLEVIILGVYAVLWQQVIARLELSIAYANKGVALIWSLIWAKSIFNEEIKLQNLIGVIIVMIGICLVNTAPTNDKESDIDTNITSTELLDPEKETALVSEAKEVDHE